MLKLFISLARFMNSSTSLIGSRAQAPYLPQDETQATNPSHTNKRKNDDPRSESTKRRVDNVVLGTTSDETLPTDTFVQNVAKSSFEAAVSPNATHPLRDRTTVQINPSELSVDFATQLQTDREKLLLDLEQWKSDSRSKGSKLEAAAKILEAFDRNSDNLELSGLGINLLPQGIGLLSNLSNLDLSENEIEELPLAFGKLTNLKDLRLMENHIKELPSVLEFLINLEVLDLEDNLIETYPPVFFEKLTRLSFLDLSKNSIEILPSHLWNLTSLEVLNLNNNRIKNLPSSLEKLDKLFILDLQYNQIESIPSSVGNLLGLESVLLGHNRIKVLPTDLGNLHNLKTLGLDYNLIEALPSSMGNLIDLTNLDLAGNQLKKLPTFVGCYTQLQNLLLKNNPDLCEVPRSLMNCRGLQPVDITGTSITDSLMLFYAGWGLGVCINKNKNG